MLERIERPDEVRRVEGSIPVRHRYTPGVAGELFFAALRERGVFLGSRCEACGFTYVPCRMFCERCFGELEADVEVGPGGVLKSFTIGHVGIEGEPLAEPVTLGIVQLDGADGVLMHLLLATVDDGSLEIGRRVEAVLKPPGERSGSILDVLGFGPVPA